MDRPRPSKSRMPYTQGSSIPNSIMLLQICINSRNNLIYNTHKIRHLIDMAEKIGGSEDLVRSLLKFKSVSKQWSNPQFSIDHTSRTNPNSLLPSARLFMYNSFPDRHKLDLSIKAIWLLKRCLEIQMYLSACLCKV